MVLISLESAEHSPDPFQITRAIIKARTAEVIQRVNLVFHLIKFIQSFGKLSLLFKPSQGLSPFWRVSFSCNENLFHLPSNFFI